MNTIRNLRAHIAQLKSNLSEVTNTNNPKSIDSHTFQNQDNIDKLQHENEWLKAEMFNAKQRYKELFELIKTTRETNNEKITSLLKEIENRKIKAKGKMSDTSNDHVL